MNQQFPFSAVVGQERLKLALLLNAVDPKVGGVLIAGPRGTAKSTLARGLAKVADLDPERFVTLPLGASEEKLVGTLNLEKALGHGEVCFSPGLLARADQGVLYMDEVNLLPDHLVDLLLDVSASGINHVERDGISHEHPARFILVGTMNPDEGELRPQLLDRFGLCIELDNQFTTEQRMAIVNRRRAFDDSPELFANNYENEQKDLQQQVARARAQLSKVDLEREQQLAIATLCVEAGVEGLRADICLQRAAIAYSAWQGGSQVTQQAIEAVAELVLVHRRHQTQTPQQPPQQQPPQQQPPQQQPSQQQSPQEQPSQQQSPQEQASDSSPSTAETENNHSGSWGEMPPQNVEVGNRTNLEAFRDKKKLR